MSNKYAKYAVLRGGSWYSNQVFARSAFRSGCNPGSRDGIIGFRVIKKSDQSYRVVRGGSWNDGAQYCRSASRYSGGPGYRDGNLGFRVINRKERKI